MFVLIKDRRVYENSTRHPRHRTTQNAHRFVRRLASKLVVLESEKYQASTVASCGKSPVFIQGPHFSITALTLNHYHSLGSFSTYQTLNSWKSCPASGCSNRVHCLHCLMCEGVFLRFTKELRPKLQARPDHKTSLQDAQIP